MRRFIIFVAVIVCTVCSVFAEIPQTINYQALLTDVDGTVVLDGSYLITFKIYDNSSGTTTLWNSGSQNVTIINGLFSIELGASPMPVFPDNLFSDSSRYLGISVGGDPEMAPLTRLTSSPYVYQALRADTANSVDWTSISNKPTVISDLLCSADQIAAFDGSNWICVDMNHSHSLSEITIDSTVRYLTFSSFYYVPTTNASLLKYSSSTVSSTLAFSSMSVSMPLILPDSVLVEGIDVFLIDAEPARDLQIWVVTVDSTLNITNSPSALSSGSSGFQSVPAVFTPFITNNQTNTYYVRVQWLSPTTGDQSIMAAGSIRVKYKIARLL